jgi:membrane fusion protein (multidrug efflux system)
MGPIVVFFSRVAIATFILFSIACSQQVADKPKKGKKPHLVETATVTHSVQGIVRTRTGTLRARLEVKIYNQEEGRVTKLPFYEGDRVKKGEVIAKLDDKLLQAQLARARATRQQAEQDLKRLKNLFRQKLTSADELSRAETAAEVAKADEEVLATRLSYTTITSPIDGVISERLTEPGNIAERYAHLLTISDPTSLITEVTVSELLLAKLSVNETAMVRIDALGKDSFKGRISRIFPNLDPVTRRGTLEVELKPVPKGARPGQLCRVQLQTQAAQRLLFPFKALRRDDSGEYVFTVDGENQVKKVKITTGLRINEQIEVIEGLESGQQVVTKGFLGLKEGAKVKVVSESESASSDVVSAEVK